MKRAAEGIKTAAREMCLMILENGRLLNIIKGREAAAGEKGVKSKSGKNCRGNHLRMAREKAAGMEEVHAGWYCNVLQGIAEYCRVLQGIARCCMVHKRRGCTLGPLHSLGKKAKA